MIIMMMMMMMMMMMTSGTPRIAWRACVSPCRQPNDRVIVVQHALGNAEDGAGGEVGGREGPEREWICG